jgi:hypothetical protein
MNLVVAFCFFASSASWRCAESRRQEAGQASTASIVSERIAARASLGIDQS